MRPRGTHGVAPIGAPTATITIPLDGMTWQAPRPALVWIDSDDATIAAATGMARGAFLETFKILEADPEYGRRALWISKKRRGVETEVFLAFIRARFAGRPAAAANDAEPASGVDAVLREIGAERVVPSRSRKAVSR
jgi:hypothetical protein